jgi:hypothetical protein
MFTSLRDLLDFSVRSVDGEIGQVADFYFDDLSWMLRYLVVKPGGTFAVKRYLLSPVSLGEPDLSARVLPALMTNEKIGNSPHLPDEGVISRQHEELLHSYFNWPAYWDPATPSDQMVAGTAAYPAADMMSDVASQREQQDAEGDSGTGENHLRSLKEVLGYEIYARGRRAAGQVVDFIANDEDWRILYVVADVGGLLPGKRVLLSPSWVQKIEWLDSEMWVDLAGETIRESPEFNQAMTIDRTYEEQLYQHYDKKRDW